MSEFKRPSIGRSDDPVSQTLAFPLSALATQRSEQRSLRIDLINNGALAAQRGAVVVISTAEDSFTLSTTLDVSGVVGVAMEDIAVGAVGIVAIAGLVEEVLAAVGTTAGQYLRNSTASSGTASGTASPSQGVFGVALSNVNSAGYVRALLFPLSLTIASPTFTGQLIAPDGSSLLPSIVFSGSLTTGFYQSGPDALDFATSATHRVRLTSDGQMLFERSAATTPTIADRLDTDSGIYWPSANKMGFAINGIEQAFVSANGLGVKAAGFTDAGHDHTGAAQAGTLDHGLALTGLTDDDHTQYYKKAGDTLSGTVSGTPTWASSQAITLSTAAQPNVTALGTLTGLIISGVQGGSASSLLVSSSQPIMGWQETDAAADNGVWDSGATGEQFQFRVVNDANSAATNIMTVDRTGTAIDSVIFPATAFVGIGLAGSTLGVLKLNGNTSGTVTIQPAAAAGTWTLTLPPDDGDAGEQLQTNGAGVTTWEAAASYREAKDLIAHMNPSEALARILRAPVYKFRYKDGHRGVGGDYRTEFTGVVADEAPWAMMHAGRVFSPISAFGHAAAAIQELDRRLVRLESVV